MSSDQRDGARVPTLGRVDGEVMVFQPMLIREISQGGAMVETEFPLHLNSLHDLRLTLADRSVVVKGRVVHSQIAEVDGDVILYWTGVEFVEPSVHVREAIGEYLDAVRTSRRA